MMTSPDASGLEDWGKPIGDAPAATAILDRCPQHVRIIGMTGRGYRLQRPTAAHPGDGPGSTEHKTNIGPKRTLTRKVIGRYKIKLQ